MSERCYSVELWGPIQHISHCIISHSKGKSEDKKNKNAGRWQIYWALRKGNGRLLFFFGSQVNVSWKFSLWYERVHSNPMVLYLLIASLFLLAQKNTKKVRYLLHWFSRVHTKRRGSKCFSMLYWLFPWLWKEENLIRSFVVTFHSFCLFKTTSIAVSFYFF